MTDDERRQRFERARRRVEMLKGFYIHLAVFLSVLAGLLIVNLAAGGPWWVQWVVLGWGIGVATHGLAVFGPGSMAVQRWEQRKVRELLDKER